MKLLDSDIVSIQDTWLSENRTNERWIIVERNGQFEVHNHTVDGVAPTTIYPTKRLAAARLLQLLGIGPVAPQDHPEEIGITIVTLEEGA